MGHCYVHFAFLFTLNCMDFLIFILSFVAVIIFLTELGREKRYVQLPRPTYSEWFLPV